MSKSSGYSPNRNQSGSPNNKSTFNPVVVSRQETMNGPGNSQNGNDAASSAALSALVHQTDRSGKQKAPVPPAPNSPHAIRGNHRYRDSDGNEYEDGEHQLGLLASICCCFRFGGDPIPTGNYPSDNGGSAGSAGGTRFVPQPAPHRKQLLGAMLPKDRGKMCLVLDLDETLVHSSFKPTQNPDYIIPVEIEGTVHKVYVCKRPGVDEFMRRMGEVFEIVVYTASLSKYADPLLDQLDKEYSTIGYRLFREHCVNHEGSYVKDLSLLNRDLAKCIIVDNSPLSYMFHPQNAIGCSTFIDDVENDRELHSIGRFLLSILKCEDVRDELHKWPACDTNDYYSQ